MKRYAALGLCLGVLVAVAPASGAAAAPAVSSQDRQYLQKSAAGDIFEIKGGQLAQRRGTSPTTRNLGARLAADHTKSLSDTRTLAKKLGVTLPSAPDQKMQALLDKFSAASRSTFDAVYANGEVGDHKEDISDASKEVTQGTNSEVKKNAQQELPTLRTHLALAKHALAVTTGHSPSSVQAGSGGRAGVVPLLPTSGLVLLTGLATMFIALSIRRLRQQR
jgi:putative membrane protein